MNKDEQIAARVLENFDEVALAEPTLHQSLSVYINRLIIEDFDQLIFILYRVDVSEAKLKQMLSENSQTDAGKLISHLIIERQLKKIKSRTESKRREEPPGDEEAW